MRTISSHYCDGVRFDILSYSNASSGHASSLQAEWRFVDDVTTLGYTRRGMTRPFTNNTETE